MVPEGWRFQGIPLPVPSGEFPLASVGRFPCSVVGSRPLSSRRRLSFRRFPLGPFLSTSFFLPGSRRRLWSGQRDGTRGSLPSSGSKARSMMSGWSLIGWFEVSPDEASFEYQFNFVPTIDLLLVGICLTVGVRLPVLVVLYRGGSSRVLLWLVFLRVVRGVSLLEVW